jgi:pyruvate dehydrogenase E2 component (dihydrolipoamide acetyltransferase)
MAYKICMPSMGAMMEEGTILSWKVKEGDVVTKGQLLFEFESDKSSFSYESPTDGVMLKILIPEGQKAAVGLGIALLGKPGEDVTAVLTDEPVSGKALSEEEALQPSALDKTATGSRPISEDDRVRVKISPRARKLAEQLKVDISTIQGSGPGGRIESLDVELAVKKGKEATQP